MVKHSTLHNEIHLWSASLSQVEGASEAILDEHERRTAQRFRFEDKRLSYIKSHWLLRRIVSGYVGEPAGSIRLAYHDKGKPYLPDHDLHISVSHSHDRWIATLTRAGEIGADIEKIEPMSGMEGIIRRYFHRDEQMRISQLDAQQRADAFYEHWTQMEAFVKMHGVGLYARMNTIGKWEDRLMFEGKLDSRAAYATYSVPSGYVVSISVKGSLLPVVNMDWAPIATKSGEE